MSNQLTLCVINYNGENYLKETLESVFIQEEKFNEIILVDNASEDKSIQIVNSFSPKIRIIRLNKNNGPASARNAGLKAASYDRILFLDNDVSLSPDFSKFLVKALDENQKASVAVPRVLFAKQKNKIQYDGADNHFLGLMILNNNNTFLNFSRNGVKKINSFVTACFLIDRKKWGNEQPFDESFLFNYEDHDFGIRTRIKGREILSVSSELCYHREGTLGLSRREGGEYSKTRVYCLIRNRWQIILKNYQLRTIVLLSPVFFIYEIFQLMGVIKKGWFVEWLKAVQWILFNSAHILHKRNQIQNSRKISDREILIGGPVPFFKDLPKSYLEKAGKKFLDFITGIYWKRINKFV